MNVFDVRCQLRGDLAACRFETQDLVRKCEDHAMRYTLYLACALLGHALDPYCAYVPSGNVTTRVAWSQSDVNALWRVNGGILVNHVPVSECLTTTTTVSDTSTTSSSSSSSTQTSTSTSSSSTTSTSITSTSSTITSSTSDLDGNLQNLVV